ncbi:Probable jasmonic acid carboxyl methyltransferase 2 [Linum perenne]
MGRPIPELSIFLNDHPSNDFNNVLGSLLPQFQKVLKEEDNRIDQMGCFVSATPGSFYGRLFPRNSLHFVHSSSALHYLSQVPTVLQSGFAVNKGQLYITKSSPMEVVEAFTWQFLLDFSLFLRSRAVEVVPGGRVLLSLLGRVSNVGPTEEVGSNQWELLARALQSMTVDGLVDEAQIDSFNLPYYAPSMDQVKEVVEKERSFHVDRIEAFEVDWHEGVDDEETRGERVAKTIRAVVEPMIESHFGGGIGHQIFKRFAVVVDEHLSTNKRLMFINLVVSLTRHD